MNTRLLGAAVLIALAVLFLPMVFSGKPPAEGGDAAVSLAIPPAPDRDLQTRTMDLSANGSAPEQAPTSADQLATVDIGSNRPLDVENDPRAGKAHEATTVTTGSGASVTQPVIPMHNAPGADTPAPAQKPVVEPTPAAPAKTEAAPVPKPAPKPVSPPATETAAPAPDAGGEGSYMLNLSAYASASGAATLQQRVRALGYPVSGHLVTQAGQQRTKVVAGPFATRTAAEAARLKITHTIAGVPATLEHSSAHAASIQADAPASHGSAASASKAGGWAVQLAAMSNRDDANALRDKLRTNGFDGFVDSVQAGGKQLWRVRAGPQTQRADAQRVHDQIKAKLGINGNIVSVP